jgi:hypothetical protein
MPRRTLVVTAYLLRFNLIVPSATSEHLTDGERAFEQQIVAAVMP